MNTIRKISSWNRSVLCAAWKACGEVANNWTKKLYLWFYFHTGGSAAMFNKEKRSVWRRKAVLLRFLLSGCRLKFPISALAEHCQWATPGCAQPCDIISFTRLYKLSVGSELRRKPHQSTHSHRPSHRTSRTRANIPPLTTSRARVHWTL